MTEQAQPAPVTKEAIAAYNKARVEEFNRRLSALCNELECDLDAMPIIEGGAIVAKVIVRTR